jgi:hypothetical protein
MPGRQRRRPEGRPRARAGHRAGPRGGSHGARMGGSIIIYMVMVGNVARAVHGLETSRRRRARAVRDPTVRHRLPDSREVSPHRVVAAAGPFPATCRRPRPTASPFRLPALQTRTLFMFSGVFPLDQYGARAVLVPGEDDFVTRWASQCPNAAPMAVFRQFITDSRCPGRTRPSGCAKDPVQPSNGAISTNVPFWSST